MKSQGKMPDRVQRRGQETSGHGKGGAAPHPTGGETRSAAPPSGKMPQSVGTGAITHTPLDVGQGADNGLGKMPERVGAPRQTQPRRR